MSKPHSILFVGNSMTFFHDMPTEIFEKMAISAGHTVTVRSITAGGRFLHENLELDDETARAVKDALAPERSGQYDYVVLQEGMPDLYTNTQSFYDAVRTFSGIIRSLDATPVLYARMGNQRGNPELDRPDCTYDHVYQTIVSAHQTIGAELDIPVAWAVRAVHILNQPDLPFDLYYMDRSHPSYAGSYIAALCIYCVIFGEDPTHLTYDGLLSPAHAAQCRQAVKLAQQR